MAAKKKADSAAPEGVATIDSALAAEAADDQPTKTVSLTSPWGSKVTVAADLADVFKDAGFKSSK